MNDWQLMTILTDNEKKLKALNLSRKVPGQYLTFLQPTSHDLFPSVRRVRAPFESSGHLGLKSPQKYWY